MPRQAPLTAQNNLLELKQAAFLCHFSNLSFEHTSLNLSDSLPFSIIPFLFFFPPAKVLRGMEIARSPLTKCLGLCPPASLECPRPAQNLRSHHPGFSLPPWISLSLHLVSFCTFLLAFRVFKRRPPAFFCGGFMNATKG